MIVLLLIAVVVVAALLLCLGLCRAAATDDEPR